MLCIQTLSTLLHSIAMGVTAKLSSMCVTLPQAAVAEPNVEIVYGFEARGLRVAGETSADNYVVGTVGGDDDRAVQEESVEGPFDLMIVADGRRSVRAQAAGVRAVERWCVCPTTPRIAVEELRLPCPHIMHLGHAAAYSGGA